MGIMVDDAQLDKAKAEELIRSIPRMPEVESVSVELYTDHTGDPAFQLVFRVRRDVQVDREFIGRFLEYSAKLQTQILHSELGRFPYTRIEQAA